MKRINIDVTKIDKTALYTGKKGTYLDLTLMDNREGRDQYGNDGFVVQDIGKERREAGEKGPILGNWKDLDLKPINTSPAPKKDASFIPDTETDDIPF